MRFGWSAGLWLLLALVAGPALGQDGDFSVDAYKGALIQSGRVVGMGGAHIGVGEGMQSYLATSACLANRYRYSTDWWDYDLSFDYTIIPAGSGTDVSNDGDFLLSDQRYIATILGMGMNFGAFGVGVGVFSDRFKLAGEGDTNVFDFTKVKMGIGYGFWSEQIVVGISATVENLSVSREQGEEVTELEAFDATPGVELAALWRPLSLDLRAGLSFTGTLVSDRTVDGVLLGDGVGGVDLPARVILPWQLGLGVSWMPLRGDLAYNAGREERARALAPAPEAQAGPEKDAPREPVQLPLDRRYLLLAFDAVLVGPARSDSVGMESFLSGDNIKSGRNPVFSLHLGAESEVLNNRLVLRLGSYLEPTRTQTSSSRIHGTMGGDVRLFHLWYWDLRLGASLDLARDYFNSSFGVGFWH